MARLFTFKICVLLFLFIQMLFSLTVAEVHEHSETTNIKTAEQSQRIFIEMLFSKYGNTTVMTYEGFEHLMNGIEIGNIILEDDLKFHHHENGTDFKQLHSKNHSHSIDFSSQKTRRRRHANDVHIHDHVEPERNTSDDILEMCLSPKQLLNLYGIQEHDVISQEDFHMICPTLIYQIDERRCLKNDVLIRYRDRKLPETTGSKAWSYGLVSILIISFSGLLVVATVPLLQRISIEGILQFLISLAVGALTGDAMLHLFPHYRGHLKRFPRTFLRLQLIALSPHLEPDNDNDHGHDSHSHENVYKGLCGLAAMYFFFLIGRIQTIIATKRKTSNSKGIKLPEYKEKLTAGGIEIVDLEREYEMRVPHEHGHSHSHDMPTSVSGMVWRVIVGDGIHNFSDGLAIGVAYANSLTGGMSTSIAVFCHELPHELGDFAMLLKKGVSIKKAICFNCLSSVLSCIGMVIGIAVGNISSASLWIFVAVGGMFIYISLVDMLPELTILSLKDTNPCRTLVLQICGLTIGTGIMLVIALYEEQLKRLID